MKFALGHGKCSHEADTHCIRKVTAIRARFVKSHEKTNVTPAKPNNATIVYRGRVW